MNIVLGGTHGLGAEIVKQLEKRDEDVFVVGRSYDRAKHGLGMAVDLVDMQEVEQLTDYIRDLGSGALKGFFWVAGFGYNGDFAKQPNAHGMALANFANVIPPVHAAWRKMLESTDPSNFVIVSSTTGQRPRADEAVYAATKHAQVGFGRSLGLESERLESPVQVALFMPGGMRTDFWEGNEPANLHEFNDPSLVAEHIVTVISSNKGFFYEETLERGQYV